MPSRSKPIASTQRRYRNAILFFYMEHIIKDIVIFSVRSLKEYNLTCICSIYSFANKDHYVNTPHRACEYVQSQNHYVIIIIWLPLSESSSTSLR
jgi:hypothetical protein